MKSISGAGWRVAALVAVLVAMTAITGAWLAGFPLPPALTHFGLPVTVAGLALAFFLSQRDRTVEFGRGAGKTRLLQEAEALNSHALITLSDSEAGIFHVNDRLLAATGYSAADILGRSTGMFYFDEDRPLFESIRAGLSTGASWSGETRLRCKDGSFIWTLATILPKLDTKGRLIGSISIRTDITKTRAASEQRDLFTMLDSLCDEVYMLDFAALTYTYMNRAALTRTGHSTLDYRDKDFWKDNPTLNTESFRAQLDALRTGNEQQVGCSEWVNGTFYDIQINLIYGSDGHRRLVILMRDKSEQAKVERAKTELISTISHELRTPMTSIKGAMGLLLSNAAGEISDKARSMLQIAHRNADRLVNIVNDILDVEKIAAGQMDFNLQDAPLLTVLDEAIVANEPFANRFDVTVEKVNFSPSAIVRYDFNRTLQVLTNLLSNAAKFSPPGGRIVISMEPNENSVRVCIRDFGKGIPSDIQPRIFQRFVQAPGQVSGVNGTGLGLHICNLIMREQNGAIGFVSKEGEGTTFFADFPKPSTNVLPRAVSGASVL